MRNSGKEIEMDFDRYFVKGELIPAIVQEEGNRRSFNACLYE